MPHSCNGVSDRAEKLQQLQSILDAPISMVNGTLPSYRALADQVEAMEEEFRQERRCQLCGFKIRNSSARSSSASAP